ncbi:hypothetical protein F1C16_19300 [Hymenobacter sp. NBH84]|uniref:hypothetical protein n=1 Tax=Hymenobacter sp. NBH84 TaxID=2596915 RepID=UPI001627092B|nr:hypothetical protein [Hymenobacter sp. NBH84]QNE41556.1 hypothetical protein F1C16_19300 [Hymenobacter sp. NBH84]
MLQFFRQLLIFSLLIGAVLYALHTQYGTTIIHPLAGYIFGFFILITIITYWINLRLVRISPDNFMAAYFGSMVLRLLLSLGLVLVYLYRGGAREGDARWTFLGAFFILYFLFAGFEVWTVLSNLRPFSKRGVTIT